MEKNDEINVRIVYRNYKPLHKIYESLLDKPPERILYSIASPIPHLNKLFSIYRKLKRNKVTKKFIRYINSFLFVHRSNNRNTDLVQYVNMIDRGAVARGTPYIVDVEKALSLLDFVDSDSNAEDVLSFLAADLCKAIVCMSDAAKKSLKTLLDDDWTKVENKVYVIKPTVEVPASASIDNQYISDNSKINLLFVGNQSSRKGLPDVLEALEQLNKIYPENVELFVVSNDAKELVESHGLPNCNLYPASFSKQDIMSKFYLPADLFILPTRADTYGLALVDSLATGTPVISTNQFAVPEIVRDGIDGRLVEIVEPMLDTYIFSPKEVVEKINSPQTYQDVAQQLFRILENVIKNRKLIDEWSKNALSKFEEDGDFSIKKRNEAYRKIYEKAILRA